MYKCVVGNRFGSSSVTGRLLIRRATQITSGPLRPSSHNLEKITENGTIVVKIGTEISLSCRAETDTQEVYKLIIKWEWYDITNTIDVHIQIKSIWGLSYDQSNLRPDI